LTVTDSGRPEGSPWRNLYGRRKGKRLRKSQQAFLDEDLKALSPGPVDWDENPDRAPLDLQTLFGGRPVWIEIGFGGGEHMVHQATDNPDVGMIGCEPYINGVATLLGKIRRVGLTNIRIHPGDARDLFDVLPDASVSRAFLLYPDPWPKKRHHRRRFVTAEHLRPLRRVLEQGAEFRVATDVSDYERQSREEVPEHRFVLLEETPWDDWIPTRYERKALREGRTPRYLTFRAC